MTMRTNFGVAAVALVVAGLVAPALRAQPAPPAPPAPPRAPRTRVITARNTPYLGIGVQDMDADRVRALKLKDDRGAEVTNVVPESPAAKAGFKDGDVVLEYNGQAVEGQEQLARLVRETPLGRQVKVTVWRNGSQMTLTPTVEGGRASTMVFPGPGEWPTGITIPPMPPMPQIDVPQVYMGLRNAMLGVDGEPLGQEVQFAEFFGVKDGVLVKSVIRSSAAEKAGIRAGDVIVKVEDTKVSTPRDITSALRQLRSKRNVTVTVVRNKKEMQIPVTLEDQRGGDPVRAMMFGFLD
jgi:serine protease Do